MGLKIDLGKTAQQNLLDLINSGSVAPFVGDEFTISLAEAITPTQEDDSNTRITLAAVPGKGFDGDTETTYVRLTLGSTKPGARTSVTVAPDAVWEDVVASILLEHHLLASELELSGLSALPAQGTPGTLVITALSDSYLYIGSLNVQISIAAPVEDGILAGRTNLYNSGTATGVDSNGRYFYEYGEMAPEHYSPGTEATESEKFVEYYVANNTALTGIDYQLLSIALAAETTDPVTGNFPQNYRGVQFTLAVNDPPQAVAQGPVVVLFPRRNINDSLAGTAYDPVQGTFNLAEEDDQFSFEAYLRALLVSDTPLEITGAWPDAGQSSEVIVSVPNSLLFEGEFVVTIQRAGGFVENGILGTRMANYNSIATNGVDANGLYYYSYPALSGLHYAPGQTEASRITQYYRARDSALSGITNTITGHRLADETTDPVMGSFPQNYRGVEITLAVDDAPNAVASGKLVLLFDRITLQEILEVSYAYGETGWDVASDFDQAALIAELKTNFPSTTPIGITGAYPAAGASATITVTATNSLLFTGTYDIKINRAA